MTDDRDVQVEQIDPREAEKIVSRFVIEPEQWGEWFEKAARLHTEGKKWATKITCENPQESTKKINLGYFQLRQNYQEYKPYVTLTRRGNIVWILPAQTD